MEGIIVGEYEDKKKCKLITIDDDGGRKIYIPSGNGFVLYKSFKAPATATHIHSKVSVKFKTEEGIMVFENGILTEVVN
jgi:hypothetical protein